MKKRIALAAGLAALLTAALVALPAIGHQPPKPRIVFTALSGQQEVPQDSGDPDGYGATYLEIVGNKVCLRLEANAIDPATAAHIHRGDSGYDGNIEVLLFGGNLPAGKRCVKTTRALAREIARFPQRFYVNVHNGPFPDGAIRGQLHR